MVAKSQLRLGSLAERRAHVRAAWHDHLPEGVAADVRCSRQPPRELLRNRRLPGGYRSSDDDDGRIAQHLEHYRACSRRPQWRGDPASKAGAGAGGPDRMVSGSDGTPRSPAGAGLRGTVVLGLRPGWWCEAGYEAECGREGGVGRRDAGRDPGVERVHGGHYLWLAEAAVADAARVC